MKVERLLLIVIILLAGCDAFHGPKLRNETGGVAEIVVKYSSGETTSSAWQECSGTFLGRSDEKVVQILVRSGDREIALIDQAMIGQMLAKEKVTDGYHVWAVRDDEIAFVTENSSAACLKGKSRQ